jgi:two-component system sensor histidine kinase ChvG
LRLDIIKIFLIFLIVSIIMSLALAFSITIPVVRLKNEAGQILDQSGNFRNHFTGFKRADEIGELSRSLTRLSADLENKMNFIDKFTTDILHELKNPLSVIRGASEMALKTPVKTPILIKNIIEEEKRMERLLGELRAISSLQNLFEKEKKERVDLSVVLPLILSRYPLKRYPAVEIEYKDNSEDGCFALINTDRLVQLITNPVDNALSLSPAGSRVRVVLTKEAGASRIDIEDEGPGIREGAKEQVFERFYSDRGEDENREHSGLGLSIARSILDYYGGHCGIENLPGKGCRFTILLPAK